MSYDPHRKVQYVGKVYTLSDKDGNVFYVGCTVADMQVRLSCHITESKSERDCSYKSRKNQRIRSLDSNIKATILEIAHIEACDGFSAQHALRKLEKLWIEKFVSEGAELCNASLYIKAKNIPVEVVGQTFTYERRKIKTEVIDIKTRTA